MTVYDELERAKAENVRLTRQVEWMKRALETAAIRFDRDDVAWRDAADACRAAAKYTALKGETDD